MYKYAILLFILFSCSANWHLNKAVKKGAELKTITETKHDTTWISEHHYTIDTSKYEHTIVEYVPQTRWRVRFDNKRFNDSLKWSQRAFKARLAHVEKLYRDSIRVEKKKLSVEKNKNNRLNRFMWWLMVFFVLILIVYIALRIVASKLLK